ncbi:MAG: DEAD/DEAH box helicase [Promethearchaeota archaeon]|nr:MAG: DEAD/DEAH box helicase [Candidatus Lokiarchaeota archaeon]
MSFEALGVSAKNIDALKKNMDITSPTPVQSKAIPLLMKGQHIMAQSKTGTGKTLAFIIPIIEQLKFLKNEALILLPTRELAKQVESVIRDLKDPKVKSMTIYGGVSINNQIQELNRGVNIVVGTPGRIIDLWKRRKLDLSSIRFVVLDEADRLWDMGFAPDVKYILSKIKSNYQFMLFSATLDADIRDLVKKFTHNKFKFLNLSRDELTVGNTRQYYYLIDMFDQKYKSFLKILRKERPKFTLVFVNTKKTGNWLYNRLKSNKRNRYKVGLISGNLSQFQRENILKKFRDKRVNMLIATDVAARGLDIDDITHVINYDVPKFPENYVHRIGRTSRMNKKGTAITLCLKDEYEYLCHIEGLIDKEIKRRTLAEKVHPRRFRRNSVPF